MWEPLDAVIRVHAERLPGPYGVLRLRVRVENRTAPQAPPEVRRDALRYALISAHTIIGAEAGTFLSLTDPPEWAARFAAECANTGTWPVLAGPPECGNLMLASPIILYDHPQIAPESAGDLFDATEIDEILTLRTLAMTDAEKAEARATDPRAADLLDRLDGLPPEMLEKMHGAIRYLDDKRPGLGDDPSDLGDKHTGPAAVGAVVGPGLGPLGVAGDRSRAGARRPRGQGQQGHHAAGVAAGRRPGSVPGRARGAGAGRAVRRGRPGARGGEPGRRSAGRAAEQPRQVSVFRSRRDRAEGETGMISNLIKAVVLAAVLALIVQSLPDVKRYLELREM